MVGHRFGVAGKGLGSHQRRERQEQEHRRGPHGSTASRLLTHCRLCLHQLRWG
ncbi:hypothetical protein J6590_073572 [Homalodisca vitripennis]|nr:hypothetical protein J6590_073572 [Homalodisca vitripennis]